MKIREIIDFVQQKNIFDMVVKALTEQMPLGRDGLTWEDKAHKALADALSRSLSTNTIVHGTYVSFMHGE